MKMKVKFASRSSARTAPTPFFAISTITFVTNFLLLYLCVSDHYPVSGQRVFWLYAVPLPRTNFYGTLDQQSSEEVGSNEVKFNGVSRDSGVVSNSLMRIVPSVTPDHFNSRPAVYQRPSYAPLITPLISRDYGYGSAPGIGHRNWPEPYYKSINHFNGGSGANDDKTVPFNRNVFNVPKSVLMGVRRNDDEQDDDGDSSGSGSTEIDGTSATRNVEEFSHFNQFGFMHDDKVEPVLPMIVDKRITIRDRCPVEVNEHIRFHAETSACYTIGTRGPCGNYMIFTASDNVNGYCECDQGSFDRPLIRVGEQCHFLYTQAMCPQGYWLTLLTPNAFPDCQPNPCDHQSAKKSTSVTKLVTSSKSSLVLFKGECVRLNSASRHCRREGEVVLFPEGRTEPACGLPKSRKRIYRRQISNVGRFVCRPGMRRHPITRQCIRSRSIMFS